MTATPLTELIFVRHGEVHNPARVFYGRLPRFGLSDEGRRQVAATARALATREISAIYASPLLRARQTARIIQREHPRTPVRLSRLLLEIRSCRQGEPHAALDAAGWNFYEPRLHPDDETIPDIAARVERFCRRVIRRHAGQRIVAVTHGDIVAIAHAQFAGRPLVLASIRGAWYPPTASFLTVRLTSELTPVSLALRVPAEPASTATA